MALRDDAYVPTLRHGQASHDWRFDSIANVNRVEHEEREGGRERERVFNARTREPVENVRRLGRRLSRRSNRDVSRYET